MYLCAAPLGSLVDRWGPRVGSLISAILGATGYFTFAAILTRGADKADENTYMALTGCYFLIGAATVGSYFAALTTGELPIPYESADMQRRCLSRLTRHCRCLFL